MPRRKKYARRRMPYRRRKRRMPRYRLSAMRAPSGMPVQNVVKQRYNEQVSWTASVAAVPYFFRANSIFDPNLTGTGHQPMGHDEMVALYNHYVVLGAKLTARWVVTTGTGNGPVMVGCMVDADNTLPYASFENIIEAKKGTYRSISYQRNQQTTTCYFSAKKFFDVKDVKDNIQRLGATTGANPGEDANFCLWMQPLDKSTSNTVTVNVTIDYIVQFSEPRQLSVS